MVKDKGHRQGQKQRQIQERGRNQATLTPMPSNSPGQSLAYLQHLNGKDKLYKGIKRDDFKTGDGQETRKKKRERTWYRSLGSSTQLPVISIRRMIPIA